MRDTNLVNALREHADWWENGDLMDPPGGLEKDLFAAADRLENQNAHIAALQQEIEKLRAQVPRWIPVTERLPDYDDLVLVIASGKPKENITLDEAFELATLYSDGWCLETWPEWTGANVTYWMPLPEPPEVENAETK